MSVDAHTHIHEPGQGRPARPAAVDDLLRELDAAGIARAVVIPLPDTASNEYVFAECARHPDRLAALYTPDFSDHSRTLSRFEAFARDHFVRGIKIHPRVQGVSVRDSVVIEVVALAAELQVPVLFDAFPYGDRLDDEDLQPLAYHRLARRFREATIILAHAGGHRVLDAFLVAKANPNVLLESSFTACYFPGTSVERDLAFAIGRLPPGRVLYGSDFPGFGVAEHLEATRRLTAGLSDAQRTAFFHDTARKVYRLEEA
jgi:predicted TIM-barrel fold metal-dependent hydrolase